MKSLTDEIVTRPSKVQIRSCQSETPSLIKYLWWAFHDFVICSLSCRNVLLWNLATINKFHLLNESFCCVTRECRYWFCYVHICVSLIVLLLFVALSIRDFVSHLATFGRKGNTFFSISINSHFESCDLYTFLTIYGSIGLQKSLPYPYFYRLLSPPSILIENELDHNRKGNIVLNKEKKVLYLRLRFTTPNMTPRFRDSRTLFCDGIMIGRYRLGTFFSCHHNWYLIFRTLASCPSTAKNGTWVRNEVRDRVISNYLILSCCQSQAW